MCVPVLVNIDPKGRKPVRSLHGFTFTPVETSMPGISGPLHRNNICPPRRQHTSNRRLILGNIFSLSLLQYSSYLFPLITIPYLTRTVGAGNFGRVSFAQALATYFVMLVNYGFSYSASRKVALEKEDSSRVRQIFGQVMWTKALLGSVSFATMVGFVSLWPPARQDLRLYLASYTLILGAMVNSEWFFQGLQEMRYITIAGLISRSAATSLIFVFVRHRDDYYLVLLLTGAGTILGGLVGQGIIWRRFHVALGRFDMRGIGVQMREGFDLFLSAAFISLYTTTNTFVLGMMTSNEQVGYYAAAEKVTSGIRSIWGPVPQALYPHFSRVFSGDINAGKRQLRIVLVLTAVATCFISLTGCLLAPILVKGYLGVRFLPSTPLVQILVFTVLVIGVNNILGVQGLLANGMSRIFRNIVAVSGLLNVALLIVCVRLFGALGAAISVVTVECLIVVIELIILKSKRIL